MFTFATQCTYTVNAHFYLGTTRANVPDETMSRVPRRKMKHPVGAGVMSAQKQLNT